jgi:hypothetical protein
MQIMLFYCAQHLLVCGKEDVFCHFFGTLEHAWGLLNLALEYGPLV